MFDTKNLFINCLCICVSLVMCMAVVPSAFAQTALPSTVASPASSPAPASPTTVPSCGNISEACCVTILKTVTCESGYIPHFFESGGGFIGNTHVPGLDRDCQCYPKGTFTTGLLKPKNLQSYCGKGNLSGADRVTCTQCIDSNGIYTSIGCIPFNISAVTRAIYYIAISLAGVAALMCIIWSAIRLQASRGNGQALDDARKRITACVVGLIFLLFSVFVINLLTGGVFGFKIEPFTAADPNPPTSTPLPTEVPTQGVPTVDPSPDPSPPPRGGTPSPPPSPVPGAPSKSVIRTAQVDEALRFYHAMKIACPNGVNLDNVQTCLDAVPDEGISHIANVKRDLIQQMKNINEQDLMCGTFVKSIYQIFTGSLFASSFSTGPNPPYYVKNLNEPFADFTWYRVGTTTPALGDLVKWTHGKAGHVAIVVSVANEREFVVIEANYPGSGKLNMRSVATTETGFAGFYRLEK